MTSSYTYRIAILTLTSRYAYHVLTIFTITSRKLTTLTKTTITGRYSYDPRTLTPVYSLHLSAVHVACLLYFTFLLCCAQVDYVIPANTKSLRFHHTLAQMLVRVINEGCGLRGFNLTRLSDLPPHLLHLLHLPYLLPSPCVPGGACATSSTVTRSSGRTVTLRTTAAGGRTSVGRAPGGGPVSDHTRPGTDRVYGLQ